MTMEVASRASAFEREAIYTVIKDVWILAGTHGGHLYGSFLWDVIDPRKKDPKADLKPWFDQNPEVKFWFPSWTQCDAFLKAMGSRLINIDGTQGGSEGILNGTLIYYGFQLVSIRCTYTPALKDILQWTSLVDADWAYGTDQWKLTAGRRVTTLQPTFLSGVNVDRCRRVFEDYIARGWTVRTPDTPGHPTICLSQSRIYESRGSNECLVVVSDSMDLEAAIVSWKNPRLISSTPKIVAGVPKSHSEMATAALMSEVRQFIARITKVNPADRTLAAQTLVRELGPLI